MFVFLKQGLTIVALALVWYSLYKPRLALTSQQSSCLSFWNAAVICVYHHSQMILFCIIFVLLLPETSEDKGWPQNLLTNQLIHNRNWPNQVLYPKYMNRNGGGKRSLSEVSDCNRVVQNPSILSVLCEIIYLNATKPGLFVHKLYLKILPKS